VTRNESRMSQRSDAFLPEIFAAFLCEIFEIFEIFYRLDKSILI